MEQMTEQLAELGPEGLVVALLVILAVFLAKRSGLVVKSDQARLANVILSFILAGLAQTNGIDEQAIVASVASIASALTYELFKLLTRYLTQG